MSQQGTKSLQTDQIHSQEQILHTVQSQLYSQSSKNSLCNQKQEASQTYDCSYLPHQVQNSESSMPIQNIAQLLQSLVYRYPINDAFKLMQKKSLIKQKQDKNLALKLAERMPLGIRNQVTNIIRYYEGHMDDQLEQIHSLIHQNNILKKKVQKLNDKIYLKEEEVFYQEKQNQTSNITKKSQINSLSEKNSQQQSYILALDFSKNQKNERIEELEGSVMNKNKQISELNKQITGLYAQIKKYKKRVYQLQSKSPIKKALKSEDSKSVNLNNSYSEN